MNDSSIGRPSDGEVAEILALRWKLEQARKRERLLERRLGELEMELAAIYRSRSWTLTAPLRAAVRRAGRLPRLLRAKRAVLPNRASDRRLLRARNALRARADAGLAAFLAGSERLSLPNDETPRVSILLVLLNQAALTLSCLRAIAATVRIPAEVVIVDNASSDQTLALLDRLDGARIIRNGENRHFLEGVNQAAAIARGEALLLLNNDAFLREGALEAAWSSLSRQSDVAAVGGPIVLPDGTLQEAGSIIWSDGACLGYGRRQDPAAPEFQFIREVDYCSAAFLLIRRVAFEALGGLDAAFAPAYYEETDLCMRLRAAGQRILYDPNAIVDHFEFGSSTSTIAALDLQRRHHLLFVERHRTALAAEHWPHGTSPLLARMRGLSRGRILLIEDRVPFPSLGAGYPRSARLLDALVADGWFVTLYPLVFPQEDWDEVRATIPPTVEVMLGHGEPRLRQFLRERNVYYDIVMVSRPHNMRSFHHAGGKMLPRVRLIYDAEAIFATRELQRLALSGASASPSRRRALLDDEIRLARAAESVIAVSDRDAGLFREYGCKDVHVLGHALIAEPAGAGHAARSDLLFVGALDDDPSPNTDAVVWFASEVMPHLDALMGGNYRLIVAGRCRAERVMRIAGPRIRLLGRVDDLTPLYASARLFVAPSRFAAGIPLKILEAAAYGLPVVATPLLAEQLGWRIGEDLLAADTTAGFAEACAALYRDGALWERLRNAALGRVSADCDPARFASRLRQIMGQPALLAARAGRGLGERSAAPATTADAALVRRLAPVVRQARAALDYLRANGWPATLRRIKNEFHGGGDRHDFATWVRLYDTLSPGDVAAIATHMRQLVKRPTFSLILVVDATVRQRTLRRSLDSVFGQIYPHWELCVVAVGIQPALGALLEEKAAGDCRVKLDTVENGVSGSAAGNVALARAAGEFVAELGPGDTLRPHTLYMLAAEAEAHPGATLIYSDEDVDDASPAGRREPHFKPDWSPELLLGGDAVGGIRAFRREEAAAIGGYREALEALGDYDLLLRLAGRVDAASIRHIPSVLYHRGNVSSAPADLLCRLIAEHLSRAGEAAEVEIGEGRPRLRFRLPEPPLVSVIIPTRDRAALLSRCVRGVLEGTDYPRLEVLVVDNASIEPATAELLGQLTHDPRVRILPYPRPFNYAAMNNEAVAQARGEIIALLNNDISIRKPDWLSEMASQALRRGVGAVGAKLYYADGTIQHAGVVTGMCGVAGHLFRHFPADAEGPDGRLRRLQSVSCVTAACMVLRRTVYQELGGLDAENLPVAYNDVDFCLRLRARGYRVIWTPHAELDHMESVSRGLDSDPENVERARREYDYMQRRWGDALGRDPFYNPNLTVDAEDCGLAFPPRAPRPWQSITGRST